MKIEDSCVAAKNKDKSLFIPEQSSKQVKSNSGFYILIFCALRDCRYVGKMTLEIELVKVYVRRTCNWSGAKYIHFSKLYEIYSGLKVYRTE